LTDFSWVNIKGGWYKTSKITTCQPVHHRLMVVDAGLRFRAFHAWSVATQGVGPAAAPNRSDAFLDLHLVLVASATRERQPVAIATVPAFSHPHGVLFETIMLREL
jgi:hypothetical protein